MRLDSIELTNFRCFESLKIDFHPRLNVFIGANGSGKTSLLEAIRLCLGTYVGQFSDVDASEKQKFYIRPQDVRFERKQKVTEFAKLTSFSCKATVNDKPYSWSREKVGRNGKTSNKNIHEVETLAKGLEEAIKHPADGPNTELPLVAYFSTDRVSADRKFSQRRDMLFSSRIRGYFNSLGDFTNIEYMKDWFKNRQLAKFQHPKRVEPGLDLMQKVIKSIPRITNIEYIVSPSDSPVESDLYISFENEDEVGFDYLSDGTKMFVSMLADIAMRCILLNPSQKANANDTSGIVMIDEVDLHLHPDWQRRVIPGLLEAFPNIQFFVTTHSPQVLSEVPKECVFLIKKDHSVEKIQVFTEGRDSNSILNDVFGVPPRPIEDQQLLNRFYQLLEEKNQDGASKILEELEKKWGEFDTDIVRANLYFQDLLDEVHQ